MRLVESTCCSVFRDVCTGSSLRRLMQVQALQQGQCAADETWSAADRLAIVAGSCGPRNENAYVARSCIESSNYRNDDMLWELLYVCHRHDHLCWLSVPQKHPDSPRHRGARPLHREGSQEWSMRCQGLTRKKDRVW